MRPFKFKCRVKDDGVWMGGAVDEDNAYIGTNVGEGEGLVLGHWKSRGGENSGLRI